MSRGQYTPGKKPKAIAQILTIDGILAQMRQVYRCARKHYADDQIDANTGKTLTEILRMIVNVQRDNELEKRIEQLEKQYGLSESDGSIE